ncbi:MAG: hypothetical protein IT372_06785, partial [Polyangiaceae bacterium]|nr:hypothetical protein [Polyangiaceae bacterium]
MSYGFVRRTFTFFAVSSALATTAMIGSGCLAEPPLEDGTDEAQESGEEVGSAEEALSGAI